MSIDRDARGARLTVPSAHAAHRRAALDAESQAWWQRLHASEPIRGWAIAELHERLRRQAAFHVRRRVAHLAAFPRSDIDDLATEAAGDALIVLLRKLEDYRGDSQFWTWAKHFVAREAPASIRRRLGRDRVGISRHPEAAGDVTDERPSPHDRAELHELLEAVGRSMRQDLTHRQRVVLTEVAINGVSTAAMADRLDTSPGAIYKSLHDARRKLRARTTDPGLLRRPAVLREAAAVSGGPVAAAGRRPRPDARA